VSSRAGYAELSAGRGEALRCAEVLRSIVPVLALAAALAGCGAAPIVGTTHVDAALSTATRAHKALVVTVAASNKDWSQNTKDLSSRLVTGLSDLRYFSAVVDEAGAEKTQVDIELHVTIEEMTRVSDRERQNAGAGAGQVKIVTVMKFLDRANGAELGRASISAAGYVGPHGGTTEDAEDEIVRQVVALVSGGSST